MESLGSAVLTDAIAAERTVTAAVDRGQLRAVLEDGSDPAQLIAEVVRTRDGEPEERRTISIDWPRSELEKVLRLGEEERVMLGFDAAQLADAFADVQAHGLRERALVVAVVALGGLGAGAGAAAAMPVPQDGAAAASSAGHAQAWINTGRADAPVGTASGSIQQLGQAASSEGSTIPTGEEVAGGIALAIAAAAFASTRTRRGRHA